MLVGFRNSSFVMPPTLISVIHHTMFKRACQQNIFLCNVINIWCILRFQAVIIFAFQQSALYPLFRDPFPKVSLNYENVCDGQVLGQWFPIPLNLLFCLATPSRHRPPDRNVFVFSIPLFLLCDIIWASPHTLGDLIFCHVFLIFTFMRLFSISPFLSPPIYMFLVLMGVWWVGSELLNRVHVPRTKKCSERRRARGVLYGEGREETTPDAIFNFCLTFKLMS